MTTAIQQELPAAVWNIDPIHSTVGFAVKHLGIATVRAAVLPRWPAIMLAFAAIVVLIRSVGARVPDRLGPAAATRIALSLSALGLALAGEAG